MTFSEARQKNRIELTPEEMREISQEINLKFAPNAASLILDDIPLVQDDDRLYPYARSYKNPLKTGSQERRDSGKSLSPKELFEISREISRRFPPKDESATPELFLLPVDPYHLYAYWNLGRSKEQVRPQEPYGNDLILRIYWLPHDGNGIAGSNVWFDVPVHEPNARQKVHLPLDDAAYSAALGRLKPNRGFEVCAYSNSIRVPRGRSKIIPVPSQDEKNMAGRNAAVVPIGPKNTFHISPNQNEEIFVESKLMDIILATQEPERQSIGKGWYAKLHFRHPVGRRECPVRISARFGDLLEERDMEIQLIPEPTLNEDTHFSRKNASGSGIRESL